MGIALTQRHPHTAGDKLHYTVNPYATVCQITIGGRSTGTVVVKYRPSLSEKTLVEADDFETPLDNTVSFETNGQGVRKRTFVLADIRLSHIEIDDSGNGGLGDFWVHISQY